MNRTTSCLCCLLLTLAAVAGEESPLTPRDWVFRSRVNSPLLRHGAGIPDHCWSPDGTRLASVSYDNTLRIWSAADGAELLRTEVTGSSLLQVAWPEPGRILVSGGHNGSCCTVVAVDPADGRRLGAWEDHEGWIEHLAVSGRRHVSYGARDGRLVARHDEDVRWRRGLPGADARLLDLTADRDGDAVAAIITGVGFGFVLLDGNDGSLRRSWEGQRGTIPFGEIRLAPNGTWGVVSRKVVDRFDCATGAMVRLLPGPARLAITPDGKDIVASEPDGDLVVLGADGTERARYDGRFHGRLRVSPDGTAVAIADDERGIQVVRLADGAVLLAPPNPGGPVADVAGLADGRVALLEEDGTLVLSNLAGGGEPERRRLVLEPTRHGTARSLAVDGSGTRLLAITGARAVLVDLFARETRPLLPEPMPRYLRGLLSHDGRWAVLVWRGERGHAMIHRVDLDTDESTRWTAPDARPAPLHCDSEGRVLLQGHGWHDPLIDLHRSDPTGTVTFARLRRPQAGGRWESLCVNELLCSLSADGRRGLWAFRFGPYRKEHELRPNQLGLAAWDLPVELTAAPLAGRPEGGLRGWPREVLLDPAGEVWAVIIGDAGGLPVEIAIGRLPPTGPPLVDHRFATQACPSCIAFLPDGAGLAVGNQDGTVDRYGPSPSPNTP